MYKFTLSYKNAQKEDKEAVIIADTDENAIKKLKAAITTCTYAQVQGLEEVQ